MVAGRLLRGHHILVKGGIYVKKNKKMIVGFLAPAVIIFLIVFLYPIIRTIMMSMYKIESVTDTMEWWTFVGLGNYQKLFTTAIFKTAMMNILKIWALGGIIVLSVSLLFGVILTSGIHGKKFFRAIIYLPNIVSAVALATMWLQYGGNEPVSFICSYSYQWNQRKEIFPRNHLYAKYCQCSSTCYYVAAVCIQF